ncbi:hypothetical protein BJY52DRAFT_1416053 [Lactarius psammicola]|nr:hypothetical protein BJY52DRAFT_1416053 [Lactarius psammicola]
MAVALSWASWLCGAALSGGVVSWSEIACDWIVVAVESTTGKDHKCNSNVFNKCHCNGVGRGVFLVSEYEARALRHKVVCSLTPKGMYPGWEFLSVNPTFDLGLRGSEDVRYPIAEETCQGGDLMDVNADTDDWSTSSLQTHWKARRHSRLAPVQSAGVEEDPWGVFEDPSPIRITLSTATPAKSHFSQAARALVVFKSARNTTGAHTASEGSTPHRIVSSPQAVHVQSKVGMTKEEVAEMENEEERKQVVTIVVKSERFVRLKLHPRTYLTMLDSTGRDEGVFSLIRDWFRDYCYKGPKTQVN